MPFLPSSQSKQKGTLVKADLSVKYIKKIAKQQSIFYHLLCGTWFGRLPNYSQQFYILNSLSHCFQCRTFVCLVLYVHRIACSYIQTHFCSSVLTVYNSQTQLSISQIDLCNVFHFGNQCNCLRKWDQFPRIVQKCFDRHNKQKV